MPSSSIDSCAGVTRPGLAPAMPDDMAFPSLNAARSGSPGVGSGAGEAVMEEIRAFVGLDVHKATISVSVADAGQAVRSDTLARG